MDIESLKIYTAGIDGYLSENEGLLLHQLVSQCADAGTIVEIGSWKGKSTVWLAAAAARRNKKIYAIDPHRGSSEYRRMFGTVWTFDVFKENLRRANLKEVVIPLVKTSREAARTWSGEPIALLWIDGEHEYEAMREDFSSGSRFSWRAVPLFFTIPMLGDRRN